MIVTLTANPSLDRTITLEGALRPGEVQSAASVREDAGGKGINVARVVAAAGVDDRSPCSRSLPTIRSTPRCAPRGVARAARADRTGTCGRT